jgi:toxin ParE1/3/4
VRILWTIGASNNLTHVHDYIAQDNPDAANDVVLKIINSVGLLADNPAMGRIGRLFDTRELIIADTPFIVPYRVKDESIEILRVLHSSMRWPGSL